MKNVQNRALLRTIRLLTFALVLFDATRKTNLGAETSEALISAWLSAQTNIQTWSAEFKQTRTLKALTQPLFATGRVWFAAPNRFHWELGDPPQTIAVRQPEQMLVIYPILKRVERYPLRDDQSGPWRDALALLEAGFPRSKMELESKFRVAAQAITNQLVELVLHPKASGARRMMTQIKIAFRTNDFSLALTELQFTDGSTLRNDFRDAQLNPKLDELLFNPPLGPDYKIVEPFKK
jgi:outer membrane lipoprotein-sorting protein